TAMVKPWPGLWCSPSAANFGCEPAGWHDQRRGEACVPIEVGVEAPDFTLNNQHRQEVRLFDFRGRRNVLLVFYPLAFTGICGGELDEVRDNLADFENDEVQILAISVDSVASHKAWAERAGYTFPLLADFWPHGAVAQAYGVFN